MMLSQNPGEDNLFSIIVKRGEDRGQTIARLEVKETTTASTGSTSYTQPAQSLGQIGYLMVSSVLQTSTNLLRSWDFSR